MVLGYRNIDHHIGAENILVDLPTGNVSTLRDPGLAELGLIHHFHLAARRLDCILNAAPGVRALRTSPKGHVHHPYPLGAGSQAQLYQRGHHFWIGRCPVFVASIVHADIRLDDHIGAARHETFDTAYRGQGRSGYGSGLCSTGHRQVRLISPWRRAGGCNLSWGPARLASARSQRRSKPRRYR